MNFNSNRDAGMAGARDKKERTKRKENEMKARKRRFLRLVVIRALSRSVLFQYSDPPR